MKNVKTHASIAIEEEINKITEKNLIWNDKDLDLNNPHNDIRKLIDSTLKTQSLKEKGTIYKDATIQSRNDIKEQNYYYTVIRKIKTIVKKYCVFNSSKYKTVYERQFNSTLYNNHIATTEGWIKEASVLENKIENQHIQAQKNLKFAINQLRSKTSELNNQIEQIKTSIQNDSSKLNELFSSNANLKNQITQNSHDITEHQEQHKKYDHQIQYLPGKILALTEDTGEKYLKLQNNSNQQSIIFDQIYQQDLQEIEFFTQMNITKRSEYFIQIYEDEKLLSNNETYAKKN